MDVSIFKDVLGGDDRGVVSPEVHKKTKNTGPVWKSGTILNQLRKSGAILNQVRKSGKFSQSPDPGWTLRSSPEVRKKQGVKSGGPEKKRPSPEVRQPLPPPPKKERPRN